MNIDPHAFNQVARTVFAPVYPLIAEQILRHTGMNKGLCLDIGCGTGLLGVALAQRSDLHTFFLDSSPQMLELAEQTIREYGLQRRSVLLRGMVESIALPTGSIHLAVSRGSVFFWGDLSTAFSEIYRVIAPGGWAYIGGGFGSRQLQEAIGVEMNRRNGGNQAFTHKMQRNLGTEMQQRFCSTVLQLGLPDCDVIHNEEQGLWLVMHKKQFLPRATLRVGNECADNE